MHRAGSAFAALLIAVLVPAAGSGQPAQYPALRLVGQLGGPTNVTAIASGRVLAGTGYRLTLYDVTDPARPRELGASAPADDFIRGIAIAGGRAFVAAGTSGLHVHDIGEPFDLRRIGSWDSPGSAESVAVRDSIAYVADGPFGVRVVDVSDPAAPREIGSLFDDLFAADVEIAGNTLLIAAGGAGLLRADISDPRGPRPFDRTDTPGFARGVIAFGGTVLVADLWEGLRIIDVSTTPARETSSLAMRSWAFDVALKETTAYVATGAAGLVTVDLADIAHPREVVWLPVSATGALGVTTAGNLAVLAAAQEGFHVIDASVAGAPQMRAVVSPLAEGGGVAAADSHVYVIGGGRLMIVDASDPSRPRQVGFLDAPDATYTGYVVIANAIAYAGFRDTLDVIDVSNPASPVKIAVVAVADSTWRDMTLTDRYLLGATEWGLAVLDLADRRKPVLLSHLPMRTTHGTDEAVGVAAIGNYAYVARGQSGVAIVDLTNPAAPVIVGHHRLIPDPISGSVSTIAASGTHVFAPICGRLDVLEVGNPREPHPIVSVTFRGCPHRATLSGDRLYLTLETQGVLEIDVSRPEAPVIVSRTVLPGFTTEVAVVGGGTVAAVVEKVGLFLLERGAASPGASRVPLPPAREGVVRTIVPPPAKRGERQDMPEELAGKAPSARQVVVRSTSDAGEGTLRQAIAGATEGDTIVFDPLVFPPGAPATIRPARRLDCVSTPDVTIDATGAGVVLDGSDLRDAGISNGISLCSDRGRVKGLTLINFPGSGITISRTNNTLEGITASGNRDSGLDIGGDRASGNRVIGSIFGLPVAGRELKYQQKCGICFCIAQGNVVGGINPEERNVIGGNDVGVGFPHATHNTLIGNSIGTDASGTAVAPTRTGSMTGKAVDICCGAHDNTIRDNVLIASQIVVIADAGSNYNRIAGNFVGVTADGTPITGATTGIEGIVIREPHNLIEGNVIEGLRVPAIELFASSEVFVIGNRGTSNRTGILLRGARRTFVGGATESEANAFSGSSLAGIEFADDGTAQNFVLGNRIDGTAQSGVRATGGGNFVQRNTISGNREGVELGGAALLRRNAIFDNSRSAIEDFSVLQVPPPMLTEVTLERVAGTACPGCRVEVFSDSADEARSFEGEAIATADGRFNVTLAQFPRWPRITATATTPAGATSSLAVPRDRPPLPPPPPRRRAVVHSPST